MPSTPRFALPYPQGIDIDNVPQWILALANALDLSMLGFSTGTLASRPTAFSGRLYYATDNTFLYLGDSGGNWRIIGQSPTPPRAFYPGVGATWLITTDVRVPQQISWASASYATGGFATSPGSNPTVPLPGTYRIGGQIFFQHLTPALSGAIRQQQEQFDVFVYRHLAAGGVGTLLATSQTTDEGLYASSSFSIGYTGVMANYLSARFETLADFTLADGDNTGIEVYVATSMPQTFDPGSATMNIQGGVPLTFLYMELVTAF